MKNVDLQFNIFLYFRNFFYTLISVINFVFPSSKPKIVVYCYHSISSDGWRFSVTKKSFEKQINYLLKNKKPLKVSDLGDYINGKKEVLADSFIITFDDGYKDVLDVKDFLKSKDIYPAVFVLSETDTANRSELETDREFLSKDDLLELKNSGWDIGSHSSTHPDFSKTNSIERVNEITNSKLKIEKDLGVSVESFAYPKGQYSVEIINLVKNSGYKNAFSVNDGYVDKKTDIFLIPRVGVDGTHSMKQFPYLALPLSVLFRKIVKTIF